MSMSDYKIQDLVANQLRLNHYSLLNRAAKWIIWQPFILGVHSDIYNKNRYN